jgi:hypothetical protein
MTHKLRNLFRALFVDGSAPSIFSVLIPPRHDETHYDDHAKLGQSSARSAGREDTPISGSSPTKGNPRVP